MLEELVGPPQTPAKMMTEDESPDRNAKRMSSPQPSSLPDVSPFTLFNLLWGNQYAESRKDYDSFQHRTFSLSKLYRLGFFKTLIDTFKKGGIQWFINNLQVLLKAAEIAVSCGNPAEIAFFWKFLALYALCVFVSPILDNLIKREVESELNSNNLVKGRTALEKIHLNNPLSEANKQQYKTYASIDTDTKSNRSSVSHYYKLTQKASSLLLDLIVFAMLTNTTTLLSVATAVVIFNIPYVKLSEKAAEAFDDMRKKQDDARKRDPLSPEYLDTVKASMDQNKISSISKLNQETYSIITEQFFNIAILSYCAYFILNGSMPYVWYVTTSVTVFKIFKELNKYPAMLGNYHDFKNLMTKQALLVEIIAPGYLQKQSDAFTEDYFSETPGLLLRLFLYLSIPITIAGFMSISIPSPIPMILCFLQGYTRSQLISTTLSIWAFLSVVSLFIFGGKEDSACISSTPLFSMIAAGLLFCTLHFTPQLWVLYNIGTYHAGLLIALSSFVCGILIFDQLMFQHVALITDTVLTTVSQNIVLLVQLPAKLAISTEPSETKSPGNMKDQRVSYSPDRYSGNDSTSWEWDGLIPHWRSPHQ